MKKAISLLRNNKNSLLFACLFVVIFISFLSLKPHIAGDSFDYVNSMNFLKMGIRSPDFTPNRLLTTFGGLELVIFLSKIFVSVNFAWIFMNTCFYFFFCFLFFKIIFSLHDNEKVALLSTLFLAGNYAVVVFGLNFLMDMGGWFFYMLSLYFSFQYLNINVRKYILFSALSVGVGLLFKEYAVLGVIPIAVILVYQNFNYKNLFVSLKNIVVRSFVPAILATLPLLILYVYIYFKFHYTYIDWLATNTQRYENFNKIAEYIKSFGSLLNLLGLTFIFGFYWMLKEWKEIEAHKKLFVVSVILSIAPLFVWPGITQRVLFVSVPAVVLVSSFLFKKCIRFFYAFVCLFLIYFLISLTMDSFILNFVNLPF